MSRTHWELHVNNKIPTNPPPKCLQNYKPKKKLEYFVTNMLYFYKTFTQKMRTFKKKCCHFADVWKVYFGQFFKKNSLDAKSILCCTSPLLLQKIGKKKHLIVLRTQFTSLIYFHNLLRWILHKQKIGLIFHYFNLTHIISEIQMCQANSFAILNLNLNLL
jgi:hypothetical protein